MFFTNPSILSIIGNSFLCLLSSTAGAAWLGIEGLFLCDIYKKGELKLEFCAAGALLAIIPSCWLAYGVCNGIEAKEKISQKLSSIPYITLTKDGLLCANKHKFNWDQLEHIQTTRFVTRDQYGNTIQIKEFAAMEDRLRRVLFESSSDLLPIATADFVQIAEYFQLRALEKNLEHQVELK